MKQSLIYSDIRIYRIAMTLLYRGRYRARFGRIVGRLDAGVTTVCELCFGDTFIASACRARGIDWTGIDVNPGFCRRARKLGFEVLEGDLFELEWPRADVFVMLGSLYHFHDRLSCLLDRIFERTDRFLLSEPTRNLSSRRGLLGRLARGAADPGTGEAGFRYDETNLTAALERQTNRLSLEFHVVSSDRDTVIDVRRPASVVESPTCGNGPLGYTPKAV